MGVGEAFAVQSCMTLTDMRLTEFMGFTKKRATTKLFIQYIKGMTLPEFMTLTEIFPTTIFSVKIMQDCSVWGLILRTKQITRCERA